MSPLTLIIIFLWSTAWVPRAASVYYTSIAGMEKLISAEEIVLSAFDEYITSEIGRIQNLKRISQHFQREHDIAVSDFPSFISNPLNAFLMIKRLTKDFDDAIDIGANALEFNKKIKEYSNNTFLSLPTEEDLKGAVAALLRLQDTYDISTKKMADGDIGSSLERSPLSADDCLVMGLVSDDLDDFNSISWMKEALNKSDKEINKTCSKDVILHKLILSLSRLEQFKSMYEYTIELLGINEMNGYKKYKRNITAKLGNIESMFGRDEDKFGPVPITPLEQKYLDTCRGDSKLPPDVQSKLFCYYESTKHPFLRIAPLKCEQLYLKPEIVLYYDVLSNSEIELMKSITVPKLMNAKVLQQPGNSAVVDYRITKTAWLYDSAHNYTRKLNQRVFDMTGFSTKSAEPYQIANYGIGGYYETHYDYAQSERDLEFMTNSLGPSGNRMTTLIFYLSDVEQGGATVFPNLNITVFPKVGTALIFNNLNSLGLGYISVNHAACPVLTGDKWIATKWIHEVGQEFLRPCEMEK